MEVLYFKWLYPDCRILVFEPDTETFRILKSNIEANKLSDIKLFNIALSSTEGERDFYTDIKKSGSPAMSLYPGRIDIKKAKKKIVWTKCLSNIVNRNKIDFLKIDVEGAEGLIISDLDKTGKIKLINEIVIEYHHHIGTNSPSLVSILQTLERNGFDYQLDSRCIPLAEKDQFQDVLIYAYKKTSS
jgi:FkbM family methyltransferase